MDIFPPLARYAAALHATAGSTHHVASPLGAWLLLALCGPASTGARRDELAAALGADVDTAAEAAALLLEHPHPAVLSAAGLWHRGDAARFPAVPSTVETGELPSQAELDRWADRHTLGLIERFPVAVTPDTMLVIATALATKVTWLEPFDVVPAAALGEAGAWAGQVDQVLRTPSERGHHQYIAATERAGDVAVHSARAADGLLVTSVIAAPEVPPADVLAVAHELAHAAATGAPAARRSLFDLRLGDSTLWTVSEQAGPARGPDGREERCVAVLPSWSATSQHDLARAALGFPAAARALAELIGLDEFRYEAKQSTVARYSRTGFEAAAVSAMAVALGFMMPRDGVVRTAELRFGHPYAVVAVAVDPDAGPWHGVPVFSAWVSDVEGS